MALSVERTVHRRENQRASPRLRRGSRGVAAIIRPLGISTWHPAAGPRLATRRRYRDKKRPSVDADRARPVREDRVGHRLREHHVAAAREVDAVRVEEGRVGGFEAAERGVGVGEAPAPSLGERS